MQAKPWCTRLGSAPSTWRVRVRVRTHTHTHTQTHTHTHTHIHTHTHTHTHAHAGRSTLPWTPKTLNGSCNSGWPGVTSPPDHCHSHLLLLFTPALLPPLPQQHRQKWAVPLRAQHMPRQRQLCVLLLPVILLRQQGRARARGVAEKERIRRAQRQNTGLESKMEAKVYLSGQGIFSFLFLLQYLFFQFLFFLSATIQ
jgi:hypothetical protein